LHGRQVLGAREQPAAGQVVHEVHHVEHGGRGVGLAHVRVHLPAVVGPIVEVEGPPTRVEGAALLGADGRRAVAPIEPDHDLVARVVVGAGIGRGVRVQVVSHVHRDGARGRDVEAPTAIDGFVRVEWQRQSRDEPLPVAAQLPAPLPAEHQAGVRLHRVRLTGPVERLSPADQIAGGAVAPDAGLASAGVGAPPVVVHPIGPQDDVRALGTRVVLLRAAASERARIQAGAGQATGTGCARLTASAAVVLVGAGVHAHAATIDLRARTGARAFGTSGAVGALVAAFAAVAGTGLYVDAGPVGAASILTGGTNARALPASLIGRASFAAHAAVRLAAREVDAGRAAFTEPGRATRTAHALRAHLIRRAGPATGAAVRRIGLSFDAFVRAARARAAAGAGSTARGGRPRAGATGTRARRRTCDGRRTCTGRHARPGRCHRGARAAERAATCRGLLTGAVGRAAGHGAEQSRANECHGPALNGATHVARILT